METLFKKNLSILFLLLPLGFSCENLKDPRPDSLVSFDQVVYLQNENLLTIHGLDESAELPFTPKESWRVPGGVFFRGEQNGEISGALVEGGTLNIIPLQGSYDALIEGDVLFDLRSDYIYKDGIPWVSLTKPADRFFPWDMDVYFLRNLENGRWNRTKIVENALIEVPFPVGNGEIIPFKSANKLIRWSPQSIEILGETGWEKIEEFEDPMEGFLVSPEGAVLVVYNGGFMEVLFIGEDRFKAGFPPGEPPFTLTGAGESLLFYSQGLNKLDLTSYEISPFLPQ